MVSKADCHCLQCCFSLLFATWSDFLQLLMMMIVTCYRAVIAESEKRNIAGVLGEEIQTLHFQNRSLQEEVGM